MSYKPNSDNEIWRFETSRYTVSCHALEEDIDPSDSFSFEDDIEFARQGESHWFHACVRVVDSETGQELGRDDLGGCSYNSYAEFVSLHRQGADDQRNTLATKARGVNFCIYFPDMVRQALDEARTAIAERCRDQLIGSLASYVSPDDCGTERKTFLANVRDRIAEDLS